MKRVIRASESTADTNPSEWEDVKWKIDYKGIGNRYMFKGKANNDRGIFIGDVVKLAAYDDADYYWARVRGNGLVEFIHNGRVQDKMQLPNYLDFVEDYETVAEYFEVEVMDPILDVLVDYNKSIKPRMMYN